MRTCISWHHLCLNQTPVWWELDKGVVGFRDGGNLWFGCRCGHMHGQTMMLTKLLVSLLSSSVVMVMTDIFQKNEINLLRKFAKIVRIFDKIDDSKNRRVINGPQSFWDFILELFKND